MAHHHIQCIVWTHSFPLSTYENLGITAVSIHSMGFFSFLKPSPPPPPVSVRINLKALCMLNHPHSSFQRAFLFSMFTYMLVTLLIFAFANWIHGKQNVAFSRHLLITGKWSMSSLAFKVSSSVDAMHITSTLFLLSCLLTSLIYGSLCIWHNLGACQKCWISSSTQEPQDHNIYWVRAKWLDCTV